MKIIGLATDPYVQDYLSKANGVHLVPAGLIVPVFKNNEGYLLGGFKSFYTLALNTTPPEINSLIEDAQKKYPNMQMLVSVSFKHRSANLVNYVLNLHAFSDSEKRFEVYEKKTRNLVKKSYKNSFEIRIGKSNPDFFALYEKSIKRLSGIPKEKLWFDLIETSLNSFGFEKILIISLYDSGKLVAANYCILSDNYIFLMFNVSDPDYWQYSINDRVYDELIKWGIEHSFDYIDFGPAVISDSSHNHFKAGFGAQRWYILNGRKGGIIYRFKAFLRTKRHNLRLRMAQ